MNRGIARRSMFESGADVSMFFEAVNEAVEEGWIEVHAYVLMTTHFHMLVRSPRGELAKAMHHIQLGYSRYFNRSRRRDGPLVRSRYQSKLVDSDRYRRVLIGYIDSNPVHGGVVSDAAEYPFGSCRAYVHGEEPAWLSRGWVIGHVGAMTGAEFDGGRYHDVFGLGHNRAQRELVEGRIASGVEQDDPVDLLLGQGSEAVARWLCAKARLADGTSPGMPLAGKCTVSEAALAYSFDCPALPVRETNRVNWSRAARALLLRDVAGAAFAEIAADLGCGRESARSLVARARTAVAKDSGFAGQVAEAAHQALCQTWGERWRQKGQLVGGV